MLSRGRVEVEKAARRGKEMIHLRQMRTDRDRMYQKLGREAVRLVEAGDLDHPGVVKGVARVKALEDRIDAAEQAMRAGGIEPEPEPAPESDSAAK